MIMLHNGYQYKLENGVLYSRFSSARAWTVSDADFFTVSQNSIKVYAK